MNDELTFLPEQADEAGPTGTPWKVLVVDDDPEIHQITRIVLDGLVFDGRGIAMLSAHSARAAREMLAVHPDTALMLLDVVMETDEAGLDLIPHVRDVMGLKALRIILRTGQPGQAPEREVILRYDINDYKSKTEMTAQKLLTATVAGLRAYEGIAALEHSRRALAEANETLEARVAERTRALAASEAHLRAVLDAVPEGVVTFDAGSTIRLFSPSAERIFGLDATDALGRPVRSLLGAGAAADVLTPGERETEGRRADGRTFPLDLAVAPMDLDGEVLCVATLRDATERHEQQAVLRRARDAAEEAARTKSEFLAMMSHEIRTPLNGILGMAQLLADSDLDAAQQDCADTIMHSGRALLTVLNDILDFSKLEAGRLDLEAAPFDPAALVDGVVALLTPRAEEKGLTLTRRIADGVPERLVGDGNRLRQVLLNLVSNALKFTERGTVTVRLEARPTEEGATTLRLAVSDTGIGVAAEALDRLFNHFVQADASISRRFGGTGLGLAICKKIVSLMGGEIGAESVPGEGSTFWVEVTLGDGAGEACAPPAPGVPRLPPLRVLLAEDNQVNQKVAIGFLTREGHGVTVVEDGHAAVEAASAGGWDVVLMDLQMPGLDGTEATRRIRALPPPAGRVPVIALSAHAAGPEITRATEAGADAHVAKPIDAAALLRTIAAVLAVDDPREDSLLDESMLDGMEAALGRRELLGILRLFASDAEALVRGMEDHAAAARDADLVALAGELQATAANFGFRALGHAAAAVAREGAAAVPALRPGLERALARLAERFPEGGFGR